MEYTMWENTPLKWHKFLTYVALPLSTALSILLLIVYVRDMVSHHWMWDETMTALSWLDIYYAIARSVLSVVALLGCLPKRRRWYGPKCVIALYFSAAAYSLLCAILYSHFGTPQDMIYQQFGTIVSCSVTGILTFIYYKKRKRLFSFGAIQSKTYKTGCLAEAKNILSESNEEEPENSVALLLKIQNDNQSKQSNASVINQPPKKGKTVSFWVAIILGIVCAICVIVCIVVVLNSTHQISSLQAENEKLKGDVEYQRNFRNDAEKENRELREELTDMNNSLRPLSSRLEEVLPEYYFYHDGAVIVTEYGTKYHTYGCQYLDGKTYWIYNVELAVYEGYTPCSVCNPPAL